MPKNKTKKIIWIEDEQPLINIYKDALRDDNYDIEFIKLGQLAIDRIKEIEHGKLEKPDLIMLDLLLPDINGDVVLREIRKSPAGKDIPVIVLTNYSEEQTRKRMVDELGTEKYLVKTEWGPIKLVSLLKESLK